MLLALVLALAPARADIPPPADYVEACTVEKQCGADKEGVTCGASFQGRADCEKLEGEGWLRACQTRGASVWTEVLCRPRTAPSATTDAPDAPTPVGPTPPTPTTPTTTTTTTAAESTRCGTPGGIGLVWIAGMIALATRRRR